MQLIACELELEETADREPVVREILLEGKYDFADAFLILTSEKRSEGSVKWLVELAGVYTSWARRRGV